jgi:hypothetical protein
MKGRESRLDRIRPSAHRSTGRERIARCGT